MPSTPSATSTATRDYLDAITESVPVDPDKKRYLIVAVYSDPFINAEGSYDHHNKFEQEFLWPAQTDEAVAHIGFHAAGADVYCCPYLMKTPNRTKGNAAWRQIIHNDVDNGLDLAKVRKMGGFVVWTGSSGHAHVYVPLAYTVRQEQHERLCEGLRSYLSGDDKIRDNDLMRPAGTYNFKPTLQGLPAVLVKAEMP